MTLMELNPRWVEAPGHWASESPKIGISFLCPHCLQQRLVIFFKEIIKLNEINYPWPNETIVNSKFLWERHGSDFENLTLNPSIDASKFNNHWHGFIKNGQIL